MVGELTAITRVPGMTEQLSDPWTGLSNNKRFAGYLYAATRWRLLPPVVGHYLRLPPPVYYRLPALGACLLLLLGTAYAHKLGGAPAAWLAALALAGSTPWLTSVEFVQFDGWMWSLLLIATFSPRKLTSWGAACLGPWVDERFVLFYPLALVIRWAVYREYPWREASGVAIYALTRLVAIPLGDPGTGQLSLIMRGWTPGWCAVGWAIGWRLGWVLLALAAWKLWRALPSRHWMPLALTVFGTSAAALLAVDYTRTAAGLAPLAVFGAARLPRPLRAVALCLVAANFALPYWHQYWSSFAPVLSILSPPPGTWIMPFAMPPIT